MAENPIQFVLNSNEFITPEENNRRGSRKDFYAGQNELFSAHKADVLVQLNGIAEIIHTSRKPVSHVKVKLIREAWAKSHRPTGQLLTSNNGCEVVGGNHFGEMLVRFDATSPERLMNTIKSKAEEGTRMRINKEGKEVVSPSIVRCEVGVIDRIEPYGVEDRISFDVGQAVDLLSSNRAALQVELFDDINLEGSESEVSYRHRDLLYRQLYSDLTKIRGIRLHKTNIPHNYSLMTLFLTDSEESIVDFSSPLKFQREEQAQQICIDKGRYEELLMVLAHNELVRTVKLQETPTIVQNENHPIDSQFTIPAPGEIAAQPLVVVADSGISDIYKDWIVKKYDSIPNSYKDIEHGTFISGLLVNGKTLNGEQICGEEDGCALVDLCIIPKSDSLFKVMYGPSLDPFIAELREGLEQIKEETGARVVNFSATISTGRDINEYTEFAQALDSLAKELDMIFVISAGNLKDVARPAWTTNPAQNLTNLESVMPDIVNSPAESCLNVSVAALNATNGGLASYSRKGKGLNLMTKPDLVHIGGDGEKDPVLGHSLYSLDRAGKVVTNCGTSFSAPLVAKSLACYDSKIAGYTSREVLLALLIHNSVIPPAFNDKKYRRILLDTIGYGLPLPSSFHLTDDDHSFTFVLSDALVLRNRMVMSFDWPQSLVHDGKCFGDIKLTMVSTPIIDPRFKSEMIRENISVSFGNFNLNDGSKNNQLNPIYFKPTKHGKNAHKFEWELMDEDMKWNPIKVYEHHINRGVSGSTLWQLDVSCLSKTAQTIHGNGIPFALILTISDPKGEAPVNAELKYNIQQSNLIIENIQTAARVAPRI